ncbi:MAG: phosphate acyltransferase PlsX [Chloroflexi bacterium]|nr:phosphate acyltransferase PlsX [Chloroflexota bacterium]
MRLALDVMGGDHAPDAPLAAARAFHAQGVELVLVGPAHVVEGHGFECVMAEQVVTMEDKPARIGRDKPDSSMQRAVEQVKEGRVDAAISAGNTGALLSTGLFTLGRLPGIDRPALGGVFPTKAGQTLLIDAGANAEAKPRWLLQFGLMGSVYMAQVFGLASPRVGLLNVGAEAGKGSAPVQEAYELLEAASEINFVGNVEGTDLPAGAADVVVCDGFTGNVVAKVSEGVASLIGAWIREEIRADKLAPVGALLLRGAFGRVRGRLAYADYGGCAPLFGLNGLVVKAHGRADAAALQYALELAVNAVRTDLIGTMRAALAEVAT